MFYLYAVVYRSVLNEKTLLNDVKSPFVGQFLAVHLCCTWDCVTTRRWHKLNATKPHSLTITIHSFASLKRFRNPLFNAISYHPDCRSAQVTEYGDRYFRPNLSPSCHSYDAFKHLKHGMIISIRCKINGQHFKSNL